MFNINFNLIAANNFLSFGLRTTARIVPTDCVNILISYQPKIIIFQQQSNGGSKPPPYHVVVCTISFATAFGCLSLTIQLLLFRKNHARLACSVVNALSTACCRYQLLRIADRGKPCSYGSCMGFNNILAENYDKLTTI